MSMAALTRQTNNATVLHPTINGSLPAAHCQFWDPLTNSRRLVCILGQIMLGGFYSSEKGMNT